MLGAFLIGFYFGRLTTKKEKNKHYLDPENFKDANIEEDIPKIRATKTFERGGKEMVKTVTDDIYNSGLNFNRIGLETIATKDNLQEIKGIGDSIEEKLNSIGIFTHKQISNFNSNDITKITKLINVFSGRIERDDWIGQAYHLLSYKEE